jgi:hypothetical protein
VEDFYEAQTKLARKTQEALARAANEEYYNKCLTELRKDSDAQLKHEMATYWAGKWAIRLTDSGITTASRPEETIPLPPDSAPPVEASLATLIGCLSDQMEWLENELSTMSPQATQAKKTPAEPPKEPKDPGQPTPRPTTPSPKAQEGWCMAGSSCRCKGKEPEDRTKTNGKSPASTSKPPAQMTASPHTEVTIL